MLRIITKALEMDEFAVRQLMVALLHDTLEDTELTVEEMYQAGVPRDVVEAVVVLTRRAGESYAAYMARVAKNELAAAVKPFDMWDNQTRLGNKPHLMAGRADLLVQLAAQEQYHEADQ
jgi:hypothetical protein